MSGIRSTSLDDRFAKTGKMNEGPVAGQDGIFNLDALQNFFTNAGGKSGTEEGDARDDVGLAAKQDIWRGGGATF